MSVYLVIGLCMWFGFLIEGVRSRALDVLHPSIDDVALSFFGLVFCLTLWPLILLFLVGFGVMFVMLRITGWLTRA